MRRSIAFGIAFVSAFVAIGDAQDRARALEEQARNQLGTIGTLCGRVVMHGCWPPKKSVLYLESFPSGVEVAIFQEDREAFGMQIGPRYVLHDVCAMGRIEKEDDRFFVRVTHPYYLRVTDTSAPIPDFVHAGAFTSCDEGVELPKVLKEVRPQYTRQALDAKIQGTVNLEGVVQVNGQIGAVRVLKTLDSKFGLDEQAIIAAKQWRFQPGTRFGRAVPVIVVLALTFKLI
jgi:TonB family protein